jgi:hypothetical protein
LTLIRNTMKNWMDTKPMIVILPSKRWIRVAVAAVADIAATLTDAVILRLNLINRSVALQEMARLHGKLDLNQILMRRSTCLTGSTTTAVFLHNRAMIHWLIDSKIC